MRLVYCLLLLAFFGARALPAENRRETGPERMLHVVIGDEYPPYVMKGGDGKLAGIVPERWRLFERSTGIRVELTAVNWEKALERMRKGDFDVIDGLFQTPEREQYLDFSPGYESVDVRTFFPAEIGGISDLASLRGFTVGVLEGDAAESLLKATGIETIVVFSSFGEMLAAAKDRKIAVFIGDGPPLRYILHQQGLGRKFRQSATLGTGALHRAVRKGDEATMKVVEAGFAAISTTELQAIDEKWHGPSSLEERSYVWLLVAGSLLAAGVAFVAVHNTMLRRAVRRQTNALAASEERFHSIYNSVSDAVFIHDAETGRIMDVNRRMCEMYGCTVEEARNSSADQLGEGVSPHSMKEAMAWLQKAKAEGPQTFEWRCRRMDGTLFWGEVRMRVADLAGRRVVIASVSDITDRKKAQAELQEATHRFALLSENSDEVFTIFTADRKKVLYVSPAYERVWGCHRQTLLDNADSWATCIDEEDQTRVLSGLTERQLKGGYAETYRIRRPDGQFRWIFDRAWPARDASGQVQCIVGIMTDITERRLLESKTSHAQKMEAIGTLAGGIAHDFNNILGAITGHAELAKMDVADVNVQSNLSEILLACKRASDLVGQILAFSRQQDQKRAAVDLGKVVSEAMRLLRAVLPSTLECRVNLLPGTPPVWADASQIHQIVMNLCSNAAHAMEGRVGSLLEVRLEPFTASQEFAKAQLGGRDGRFALITVVDNGRGMDRATCDRIFEPFFTTKAPGRGSGLGLSVVHGIVQRHQGIISVESSPGRGTTFKIYLPAHDGAEPLAQNSGRIRVQGEGQRILVVDDEEPLVRLTGRILQKLGYASHPQTDPLEAMRNFEEAPDEYDLVLTDLTMPGATGLDLAALVTKLRPGLPVILMTGYYSNLSEQTLRDSGVTEVLVKPVDLENLSASIGRALQNAKA